ncbi:MAG TPA: PepSY domain-containing protein [Rhodanobacteraceae bacterium]
MLAAPRLLKPLRTAHLYLGVFIAPMLLFFAFTGALQSVNLHETTRGSSYRPPAWIVTLAHIHKKQSLAPARPARPKRPAGTSHRPSGHPAAPAGVWPLKIFFVLVALGLMTSTLTGLYMAWRHMHHHRRRFGAVLLAGIVTPIVLLML